MSFNSNENKKNNKQNMISPHDSEVEPSRTTRSGLGEPHQLSKRGTKRHQPGRDYIPARRNPHLQQAPHKNNPRRRPRQQHPEDGKRTGGIDSRKSGQPYKVFLTGLSYQITPKILKNFFKRRFPSTLGVEMRNQNRKTGKISGFAFLTLTLESEYQTILKQKTFQLFGRKFFATQFLSGKDLQKKKQQIKKRRVFLTGIPHYISDSDLKDLLESEFGRMEYAFMIEGTAGLQKSTGYGYACFDQFSDAQNAVKVGKLAFKGFKIKIKKFEAKKTSPSGSKKSGGASDNSSGRKSGKEGAGAGGNQSRFKKLKEASLLLSGQSDNHHQRHHVQQTRNVPHRDVNSDDYGTNHNKYETFGGDLEISLNNKNNQKNTKNNNNKAKNNNWRGEDGDLVQHRTQMNNYQPDADQRPAVRPPIDMGNLFTSGGPVLYRLHDDELPVFDEDQERGERPRNIIDGQAPPSTTKRRVGGGFEDYESPHYHHYMGEPDYRARPLYRGGRPREEFAGEDGLQPRNRAQNHRMHQLRPGQHPPDSYESFDLEGQFEQKRNVSIVLRVFQVEKNHYRPNLRINKDLSSLSPTQLAKY